MDKKTLIYNVGVTRSLEMYQYDHEATILRFAGYKPLAPENVVYFSLETTAASWLIPLSEMEWTITRPMTDHDGTFKGQLVEMGPDGVTPVRHSKMFDVVIKHSLVEGQEVVDPSLERWATHLQELYAKYIEGAESIYATRDEVNEIAEEAAASATTASQKAHIASESAANANVSSAAAKLSELAAKASQDAAKASETNAGTSERNASTNAGKAEAAATRAEAAATSANAKAVDASNYASTASTKANEAAASAHQASQDARTVASTAASFSQTVATEKAAAKAEIEAKKTESVNALTAKTSEGVNAITAKKEEGVAAVQAMIDTIPEDYQTEISGINSRLNTKQDTLVSGTNIKTINGRNILGSGNIVIEGGGGGGGDYDALEE
ncbi:MAG: hypothetical protein MJZ26_12275, partial [Fibrobacter sp.]|nr:hypothetical protein [Fibrobacter sp.]